MAWQLDARWSVVPDVDAFSGGAVLWGHWGDFGVGCPIDSDAALTVDLDLSDASAATLEFAHTGGVCNLDTLRVQVSTQPGGEITTLGEPVPMADHWAVYRADLSPWLGLATVRVAVGFSNVCGDPCGVNWKIDEFRVCAEH